MASARKFDHISPILDNLGWLKIEESVKQRDSVICQSLEGSEWQKTHQKVSARFSNDARRCQIVKYVQHRTAICNQLHFFSPKYYSHRLKYMTIMTQNWGGLATTASAPRAEFCESGDRLRGRTAVGTEGGALAAEC